MQIYSGNTLYPFHKGYPLHCESAFDIVLLSVNKDGSKQLKYIENKTISSFFSFFFNFLLYYLY